MRLRTIIGRMSYRKWLRECFDKKQPNTVFSMKECIFDYCPHPAQCVISCRHQKTSTSDNAA